VQPFWPGVETVEGATRYVETSSRANHPVVDAHGAFQDVYDLVFIVRMQTDFGIGLIPQFDELRRLIAANLAYSSFDRPAATSRPLGRADDAGGSAA
jgi:hypothetical protein